jgi:hypothetical protein
MAEMPDVLTGEVIDADLWGNPIRDRTVQRYIDVAERDAEHPSPASGDVAYMSAEVDNYLTLFHAGGWRQLVGLNASGTAVLKGTIQTFAGTSAAPSYSWSSDTGTGMYRLTTGVIGWGISANRRMTLSTDGLEIGNGSSTGAPLLQRINSEAAPGYAFVTDPDTGLRRAGSGQIHMSLNGVTHYIFQTDIFTATAVNTATTTNPENVFVFATGQLAKSTSSMEAKTNFVPLENALDVIRRLNPFTFTSVLALDDPDKVLAGFGAEEVAEVIPEAEMDKNYDLRAVVAYLVKAVQELAPAEV